MPSDLARRGELDYLDRQGQPIDRDGFVRRLSDRRYSRVARSAFYDYERGYFYDVSTIWLGIDMSFGDYPPILFETMVFTDDSDPGLNEWGHRWSTEEDAFEGHRLVARALSSLLWQPLPAFVLFAMPREPRRLPSPQKAITA